MKKFAFLLFLATMMFTVVGCGKGNVSIKPSEIESNTMLVQADGTVQVATIEEFKESYYDIKELESYVLEELAQYHSLVGNDAAITLVSLEQFDDHVVLVLQYASMEDYARFNDIEAKFYSDTTSVSMEELPQQLQVAQKEETIRAEDLLALEKVRIVILHDDITLRTGRPIKYYANGELVNEHEIQTVPEGTVVVYEK